MGGRGFDSEQVNPGERSASVFISPVYLNQSHTERLKEKKPMRIYFHTNQSCRLHSEADTHT